jgi:hypothetical protein
MITTLHPFYYINCFRGMEKGDEEVEGMYREGGWRRGGM